MIRFWATLLGGPRGGAQVRRWHFFIVSTEDYNRSEFSFTRVPVVSLCGREFINIPSHKEWFWIPSKACVECKRLVAEHGYTIGRDL